jgi:UDP-N-acetylmuramoyl-tripeptide--D-alanyl-D-alanine ligase
MKKIGRWIVAAILGYQVRQLIKKTNVKIIGVAGSIGKTSTKLAIAKVLSAGLRVRYEEGNYNDLVTVPLIFFGQEEPALYNPFAWLKVFLRNQRQISRAYPYDAVVVEIGSDGPGQVSQFKKYLKLEIGVISAITPEHMAFFKDMDEVAGEELALADYSSLLMVNKDLCDEKYLSGRDNLLTYSLKGTADYTPQSLGLDSANLSVPEQYSRLAAAAVAVKLDMQPAQISEGLKNIGQVSGRMQKLAGISSSIIIDDSYNASPEAVKLALDTLYQMKAAQKIVLLGNMNELGGYAKAAHEQIGAYCDPKQLNLVVTLGPEANKYLAPAAEAAGCTVRKFDSPYAAGDFIKSELKPGAAILVKGSQNKVFAEEAIKVLLADPNDQQKLVRQSDSWLNIKRKTFEG